MSPGAWIAIVGGVIFLALFALGKRLESRDRNAYHDRMRNDPEFARQQHEVHKYDDWEDMGYFDGR